MKINFRKQISTFVLVSLILSQLFLGGNILFTPKVAKAQLAGLATVPTADIPTIYERIAIGIARGILEKFTESFLTRFTNRLVDKYKIRNYLYYDRVLTNYYLNRYIADNITDPDLRDIYSLMERAYVSGQPTGTTNAPDPRAALIPRLNAAIAKAYINKGGLDKSKIYKPSAFASDKEYFAYTQAYFSNPEGFTAQNLNTEFGEFQSSATSASQLEILVGNSLKSGRIIGGTCKGATTTSATSGNPNVSPAACSAAGGTWQQSAVDQARSFIDNPAIFVQNHLDAAIKQHFNNLYNPTTDFWTQIGKSFGRFIWTQLGLDRSGGTLSDSPTVYFGEDYGDPNATAGTIALKEGEIDIDGDGIVDGIDYTNDGVIDICSYGGSPPSNCAGSATIINPPTQEEIGCENIPPETIPDSLLADIQAERAKYGPTPTGDEVGALLNAVAWNNRDDGWGLSRKDSGSFVNSPAGPIAGDILHHQPSNIIFDVLIGWEETADPAWQCVGFMTDPNRPWVAPVQP